MSSEEDDLTLSKSPPSKKKFKINDHDFYDGLSEDYYSSPKRSSRFHRERRRSSRLEDSEIPKNLKYSLRSVKSTQKEISNGYFSQDGDLENVSKHENYEDDQQNSLQESDDSINDLENNHYSKLKSREFHQQDRHDSENTRLKRLTRSVRDDLKEHQENSEESVHEEGKGQVEDEEEELEHVASESNSDDEVWQEEEESEEDDFLDLDLNDNVRMTRSRKAFYPKGKDSDGRSLRKKAPVNYANQMYPQAFKDVDALVELDRNNVLPMGFNQKNSLNGNRSWGFNIPRTPSKLFRLNEVCIF